MKCKTCGEDIVGFDINGICEDCVNEEDQAQEEEDNND